MGDHRVIPRLAPPIRIINRKNIMKKLTALCVFALGVSACGLDASKTDIDEPKFIDDVSAEITARTPDEVTVYMNVDDHPSIVKVCIEGVAFRTISSTHSGLASGAVERVPEWDASC